MRCLEIICVSSNAVEIGEKTGKKDEREIGTTPQRPPHSTPFPPGHSQPIPWNLTSRYFLGFFKLKLENINIKIFKKFRDT